MGEAMDGAVTGGLALLVCGVAVSAFCLWQALASDQSDNKLWAVSNGIESWLYGIGGALAAVIGAIILLDNFA